MSGIIASTRSRRNTSRRRRRPSRRISDGGRPAVDGRRTASPQLRSSPGRTRRLVALSSTTSTGRPREIDRHTRSPSRLCPTCLAEMSVEVERAPFADLALDRDLPSHQGDDAATRSSGPGPSRRSAASSIRRPGRTARRSIVRFSDGMPMPVSVTANSQVIFVGRLLGMRRRGRRFRPVP